MSYKELLLITDALRDDSKRIAHYGVKRRSGRYPWGSGDTPYQHSGDFLNRYEELRSAGLSDKEIAEVFCKDEHLESVDSISRMKTYLSLAKHERKLDEYSRIRSMSADGMTPTEIGRIMGKNESTIRGILENEGAEKRINASVEAANFLKGQVESKGLLDVGAGVEHVLRENGIPVSETKLKEALTILEGEGYGVYGIGIQQVANPNQQTNVKVLAPIGMTEYDVYQHKYEIQSVGDYLTADGDAVISGTWQYPESLDSSRILIRYREEGGLEKDGTIELRRNVEDISLGESKYAQVRVLVDGTHYLKGMAVYGDDFPDGVDVIFNTNKPLGTPQEKVFKEIKTSDPNNPFGSYIPAKGQRTYFDEDGNPHLSVINKCRSEGDWDDWSNTLASQFLSKQNYDLAEKQLNLAKADHYAEYDTICSLTNPTVKKYMLEEFAESCDSAAVHLQAAALPRQRFQVILPMTSIKEDEIYAPNFKDGEQVALVRYPHGGTFEIPVLTVNNKLKEGKNVIGNDALDAVGISSKVAERLSGADFDGDTVLVIPTNNKVKITSTPPLKGLEGFDTKVAYGPASDKTDADGTTHYYNKDGIEYKTMHNTQNEMGRISNLINDMTLKGATDEEKARAVRHSMVVIDAEKHHLDYRQSYKDNGIAELKSIYQGHFKEDGSYSESASTLLSRASGEVDVLKRKGNANVNPNTGEKSWDEISYVDSKGKLIVKPSKIVREEYRVPYKDKDGKPLKDENGKILYTDKTKLRMQKSTQMAETTDARTLSSGTRMENLYADYANSMKALANTARKEAMSTPILTYSKEAAKKYEPQVKSLSGKLLNAEKNAPKERQAQIIAGGKAKAARDENPDMSKDEYKKIKQQALATARVVVGADGKNTRVQITPDEWEAIQSGAIHDSKLRKILVKSDSDKVKEMAMPKSSNTLSTAKVSRLKALSNSGHTNEEIAKILGISTSSVVKYLKES